MDIAYYISDLLGQQGELSVPNLGYFAQIRKPAYYDEMAKKFFPPQYVVQYDPQVIEGDDSLAEYITRLKKISIASSRYFIEKYITGLKTQVVVEDIPFADLGKFSSDGVKLTFHPGAKTNAPQFFAFPPIAVTRLHGEPPEAKPTVINKQDQFVIPPAMSEPAFKPSPIYPQEKTPAREPVPTPGFKSNPLFATEAPPRPVYNQPEPVYVPEHVQEEEITPYMNIWTIVLIAITVLAIAFVILYKFKPGPFKEWFGSKETTVKAGSMVVKRDSVIRDTPLRDAVHTDSAAAVKADTATKSTVNEQPKETTAPPVTTAPPAVTTSGGSAMPAVIPRGLWIIYAGTFPIRSLADNRIKDYKAMGYEQARLLKENVKVGNNYKVILGAYPTKAEADAAAKEILMAHSNIELSIEKY